MRSHDSWAAVTFGDSKAGEADHELGAKGHPEEPIVWGTLRGF